jgi:uncharacterized membrane protein
LLLVKSAFMELLIILFLIVILAVIVNQGSHVKTQMMRMEAELDELRRVLLRKLPVSPTGEPTVAPPDVVSASDTTPPPIVVVPPVVVPDPVVVPEPAPIPEAPPVTIVEIPEVIVPPSIAPLPVPPAPSATIVAPKNTDIEKFIGENLISKIGIAILVLAIGFFVKYAIDKDWIGPASRVAIGLLSGSILIGLAHRLRRQYTAFSSILVGGGIGVFYFTITLAYHQFHLIGQTTAFLIMIVITAFATLLSLLYNRQELAIIALVGGFAAPFMVSNGSGHYVSLFTYMALLNCGLLVIAYFKKWRLLNVLAFAFTMLIFSVWMVTQWFDGSGSLRPYRHGFIFASIFYLQFFILSFAHHLTHKTKFIAQDFILLLLNTFFYAVWGLFCLDFMGNTDQRGFFSAAIGIFNLLASRVMLRGLKRDTTILYLLIGITLTFISLAAPLQLHGNYITLFWASEAVLLFWLFTRSKISLLQIGSLLVWVAMLISLLMDWTTIYLGHSASLPIVFNKGVATGLYAAAATFVLMLLRRRYTAMHTSPGSGSILPGPSVLYAVAVILFYISGVLEIIYQFQIRFPDTTVHHLYFYLFTVILIAGLHYGSGRSQRLHIQKNVLLTLSSVSVLLYLLLIPGVYYAQAYLLAADGATLHFSAHWLGVIVLIGLIVTSFRSLLQTDEKGTRLVAEELTWVFCITAVLLITIETHLLINALFYDGRDSLAALRETFVRAVMPVLWGLCSFVLMWMGMRYRYKNLRIISLVLFGLTLFKLFVFDIRNISPAGKIIAFFCLGVLLLLVSFMYQRLKKMIIDDVQN